MFKKSTSVYCPYTARLIDVFINKKKDGSTFISGGLPEYFIKNIDAFECAEVIATSYPISFILSVGTVTYDEINDFAKARINELYEIISKDKMLVYKCMVDATSISRFCTTTENTYGFNIPSRLKALIGCFFITKSDFITVDELKDNSDILIEIFNYIIIPKYSALCVHIFENASFYSGDIVTEIVSNHFDIISEQLDVDVVATLPNAFLTSNVLSKSKSAEYWLSIKQLTA
jgi:hypothetical protein